MKINTVNRPYILTFHSSMNQYRLTSEEAQRLIDEYPAVKANSNRVILQGHNSAKGIRSANAITLYQIGVALSVMPQTALMIDIVLNVD